jgi:hypothetical protein
MQVAWQVTAGVSNVPRTMRRSGCIFGFMPAPPFSLSKDRVTVTLDSFIDSRNTREVEWLLIGSFFINGPRNRKAAKRSLFWGAEASKRQLLLIWLRGGVDAYWQTKRGGVFLALSRRSTISSPWRFTPMSTNPPPAENPKIGIRKQASLAGTFSILRLLFSLTLL